MATADHKLTYQSLTQACPAVREGEAADAIAGLPASFVASPASLPEAAAVMRAAARHGLAVIPRGAGTRLGWGTPPARAGLAAGTLVIDTLAMDKVIEHAAGDLVARVQAGARMGAVAQALASAGQEVALDVPAQSTVGGIVASGLAGPRRLRYGSPRDLMIGITIIRADGTVARSGGKVVKNVAGYDLGKLLAGSWGTLGLIAEVTFRLHPLPAARAFVTAAFPGAGPLSASPPSPHGIGAAEAVALAASSPLTASAVQLYRPSPGGPLHVGVLLEGSAEGVASRAARLADAIGGGSGAQVSAEPPSWWPGMPGPGTPGTGSPDAGAPGTGDGTLVQVSFWQSALPAVLGAIDAADADGRVRPLVSGPAGAGLLYVAPDPGVSAEAVTRFTCALRERLHHSRGSVVVLRAPAAVRPALGSCGGMTGPVPSLRLMRAVKDQFDPDNRMSPGRFPAEGT